LHGVVRACSIGDPGLILKKTSALLFHREYQK
jgi:hypothetical protein